MAKWAKITESKSNGYYIGWFRQHPEIHVMKGGLPYSKTSLVQIGGRRGGYEVLAETVAHIIGATSGMKGTVLLKEVGIVPTLSVARRRAAQLKSRLAKRWDRLSRG